MYLATLRRYFKKSWLGIPLGVWLIAGIALALKVTFLMTYQNGRFLKEVVRASDGHHYYALAKNMLTGKGYVLWNHPSSYRPPLYPLILVLSFFTFDYSIVAVRFIQTVLSAVTCLMMYILGKESVNERIGFLSALFTMLYFRFTFWSIYILTETLYIFLSVLTITFLISALKGTSRFRFFMTGILWGITFLCRPEFGGFLVFVLGYMALREGILTKAFMQRASLLVIGTLIAIAPWAIRNALVHHAFILGTTTFGTQLYGGNSPYTTGGTDGWASVGVDYDFPPGIKPNRMPEVECQSILVKEALQYIRENPGRIVRIWPRKLLNFYRIYPSTASLRHKIFMGFQDGFLYVFTLIGTVVAFRRYPLARLFFLYGVFYTILITLLISELRYRFYITPFWIVLAAVGFDAVSGLFRKKKKARANTSSFHVMTANEAVEISR
ncbi:MAG: glycosyltransferase family 39 protein [Candidatus Omnitrophica bacterium]|nr:glycosyltransferase family 39 protein [Candidatus Omnitrophota bacterium]